MLRPTAKSLELDDHCTYRMTRGRYDEIRKVTYERYLLDLMRSCAAEEERLYKERNKEPLSTTIRKIDLVNPGTDRAGFRILSIWPKGREFTEVYSLYTPEFSDGQGRLTKPAGEIVGDILMWARGG